MVNLNIVDSIKNNNFIPLPNVTVHNYGEREVLDRKEIAGSWDFFGMDDFETYQKNLKTQSEDWYYRRNSIKYTLNSEGYRTKEFNDIDWESSIVMFGCSHVFGTGNDDSHTISSFLEKYTGIPVVNLGMGGSSIQFALHNSLMLFKKYGIPKAVVYGWTSLTRYLLYQKDFVQLNMDYEDNPKVRIADHLIPFNLINVELIRSLWKDKCQCYEFSLFPSTSKIIGCDLYERIGNDYARDLSHCGKLTNKLFAHKIYNQLKL